MIPVSGKENEDENEKRRKRSFLYNSNIGNSKKEG